MWSGLLSDGLAAPGPLGIGVSTDGGRLLDAQGRPERPLFTLGAPRRGELWETTAIPEIRAQAKAVADAVLAPLGAGPRSVRRRPTDQFGLPLSTHAAAAEAFRCGLARVITVRGKAAESFARATRLDPGFALGHAALALLGHECGADVDVARELADAQRSVRERGDERERSFVDVVTRRIGAHEARAGAADDGDTALVDHLGRFPADAFALGIAVPTIAFSGVTDLDGTRARDLVERTAPAYDGHWFHTSLLAFVRQEQGGIEEAGELARTALAAQPASGHAVHALAHVHYESGSTSPAGTGSTAGSVAGDGGRPPGALLLARGAARTGPRRLRGRTAPLVRAARPGPGERGAGPDRLRIPAVAGPHVAELDRPRPRRRRARLGRPRSGRASLDRVHGPAQRRRAHRGR